MSRDEIALRCLLTILEQSDLRRSILDFERERKGRLFNHAHAYARVAWAQADEFIRAGADKDAADREAVNGDLAQEIRTALRDVVSAVESEVPSFAEGLRTALDRAYTILVKT